MPDKPHDTDEGVVVSFDRTNVPKSPTFCELYANDTFIQMTPWDVRIMLGVITDADGNQNDVSILRVADVRMSLHHAKKIAKILTAQIERYERSHGTLDIPD